MPITIGATILMLIILVIGGRAMLSKWQGRGGVRIAIAGRWIWFSPAELEQIRRIATIAEQAIINQGMRSETARQHAMETYTAVALRWLYANPDITRAKGLNLD